MYRLGLSPGSLARSVIGHHQPAGQAVGYDAKARREDASDANA